jgi:hypothetical protein
VNSYPASAPVLAFSSISASYREGSEKINMKLSVVLATVLAASAEAAAFERRQRGYPDGKSCLRPEATATPWSKARADLLQQSAIVDWMRLKATLRRLRSSAAAS